MRVWKWNYCPLAGGAWTWWFGLLLSVPFALSATPVNKAALAKHYDRFLAKHLNHCSTCHLPTRTEHPPESLDEFPHNPFGDRLRRLGQEWRSAGRKASLALRLRAIAGEDSDGDGTGNEIELLLGHGPGDSVDRPTESELAQAKGRREEFEKYLASYHWEPFQPVKRPDVPRPGNPGWVKNPIDSFISVEREARQLQPRPEASKEILLRRVYLDLIGLSPTLEEQEAFANDTSHNAFEKVVDRLLEDPRYGERWGRHWMDIWRYSDWAGWTDGGQVRDSKPHIWRWRDWIVEALNQDKGYDRMMIEMLAADELAPEDTNALRATGFLVRNFKMLSREQWLEDTIKHTSQAFLGLTMGCAKCHNHMFDPIQQREYYQLRAIFEPHQVRTDRIPGQADTLKDGLVRVFDTDTNPPTYFFVRGDERRPDTNRVLSPGVPTLLGGTLNIEPASLPHLASHPDKREFVIHDVLAESERKLGEARQTLEKARADQGTKPDKLKEHELNLSLADVRHAVLVAAVRAEKLEDVGEIDSEEWKRAAQEASTAQRQLAVWEAKLKLHQAQTAQTEAQTKANEAAQAVKVGDAEKIEGGDEKARAEKVAARKLAAEKADKGLADAQKKTSEAEKTVAEAEKRLQAEPTTAYQQRAMEKYPATSTGRRLAFAQWLAGSENPLTARVAMNHVWLRHFGQAIVPSVADFGAGGRPPTHPQLLDWLASEFMARNWSMKKMHRLMVASATYRMASTTDAASAKIDADNHFLWRMNSRRMEAEIVRDNVLSVSSQLDPSMGGPEVDHKKGLESKRRSVYLRIAAEKEVEFLKIFDSPSVTECYERKPSVMPQQALALANSELTLAQSRRLAGVLTEETGGDAERFVARAFLKILSRHPIPEEMEVSAEFLKRHSNRSAAGESESTKQGGVEKTQDRKTASTETSQRARENFILVLLNHNDFVTIR